MPAFRLPALPNRRRPVDLVYAASEHPPPAAMRRLGRVEGTEALRGVPLLALPRIPAPVFALDSGMMVAVVLIPMPAQLDTLGSAIILDKMDDADGKRANMQVASGALRANGLGDFVAGLGGSFHRNVSSANIALAYATRTSARGVGFATAAILALVAFLPQGRQGLPLITVPAVGAVALYAEGFLMVSGMEVPTSRAVDSRGVFAVGLTMAAGLAVMQMPQPTAQWPPSLHFLLSDGFIVSGQVALEAAEAIAHAGGRALTGIRGGFDEFHFDLELLHSSNLLALGGSTCVPDPAALLDSDDRALDTALAQLSGRLLLHLSDRVSTTTTGAHPAALRPCGPAALRPCGPAAAF